MNFLRMPRVAKYIHNHDEINKKVHEFLKKATCCEIHEHIAKYLQCVCVQFIMRGKERRIVPAILHNKIWKKASQLL